MHIRLARPDEAQQAADWMTLNLDKNDAHLGSLTDTLVMVVEDEQGAVCYVPLKAAVMVESLAFNPGAHAGRRLRCLAAIQKILKQVKGKDVYYLTKGEQKLDKLAKVSGWSELPFKIMRLDNE